MSESQTTPSVRAMLSEAFSLVCVMAVYGPPVIFVVAPWLFLGLVLSGPFALLATFALAAALLVAALAALAMLPFLALRALRAVRLSFAPVGHYRRVAA